MYLSDLFEDDINFEPKQIKLPSRNPYALTQKAYGPEVNPPEPPGIEKLGRGVLAYAVSKKSKPHEVKRVTYNVRNLDTDPYITYLKAILKIKDSPYVPKIYSVKIFKKTDDEFISAPYMMYVELERLNSWRVLTWKQISYLFNRYMGTSISQLSKERISSGMDPIESKFHVMTVFVAGIERVMTGTGSGPDNITPPVNDEELSSVAKYLGNVVKEFKSAGMHLDMHKGNVMYRTTPTGVFPVITDPFHSFS